MSSNIFVQGSRETQIYDLASYISKLRDEDGEDDAPYVQEIRSLLNDKKDDVIIKLAQDSSFFLTRNDREVEGAFNLLIVIILGSPASVQPKGIDTLLETLTKTESNKTSLKQKILLNLYNALPVNSTSRYNVFLSLLNVTAQADELESLHNQLEHIDVWVKQWSIDKDSERKLYQHISEILKQSGEEKLSFDFQLKELATYDADADVTNLAKQAVLRAVEIEDFFAFEDLIQYSAIQKLKGTPEYELLQVFLNGTLATYKQFVSTNGSVVEHMNAESNIRKIRLLTLASLGSENLARELTYAGIAKNLDIAEDEVEMWVIDVIRAGLVEAKLDQLNKTVIVHRSIYRVFGKEQWQQLGSRLRTWKESLNEILGVLANAKLIAGGVQQGGPAGAVEDKSNEAAVTTSS